jgi:DNA-binding NarL/FixJ family response regulator
LEYKRSIVNHFLNISCEAMHNHNLQNECQIKIALADDHRIFRQAIRHFISGDSTCKVVLEADNGLQLINQLSVYQPDIVLLDIKMPEMNGLEALKYIHKNHPEIKSLILTAFIDEVYIAQALKFGIYGFLSKTMDIADLMAAVKSAYLGEVFVSNLLNSQIYRKYLLEFNKNSNVSLPGFSEDEIRILDLIKAEKTIDEISLEMHLSKRSIEIKRDKMKCKSNTRSTVGLLLYALKRGIIE